MPVTRFHKHAAASLSNGNTYAYDANGNMIQRVIGSEKTAFEYDAEGHLVRVCSDTDGNKACNDGPSTIIAEFSYDGDGKRVQSTESGVITAFVGTHYEVRNPGSGETVTKYYGVYPAGGGAGATRIASRKYTIPQSMAVEYLLGDHLGSASVTTDADGYKVSEIRYKPWGEVRYAWTDPNLSTTPAFALTKYTFTGQFSYMDDPTTSGVTEGFGWMYYNARWYDPVLSRFSQADTIIPQAQGVQAWDRFAYSNNNPVRYSDPSGHERISEGDQNDRFSPSVYKKYRPKSIPKFYINAQVPALTVLTPQLPQKPDLQLPWDEQEICGFVSPDARFCDPGFWSVFDWQTVNPPDIGPHPEFWKVPDDEFTILLVGELQPTVISQPSRVIPPGANIDIASVANDLGKTIPPFYLNRPGLKINLGDYLYGQWLINVFEGLAYSFSKGPISPSFPIFIFPNQIFDPYAGVES